MSMNLSGGQRYIRQNGPFLDHERAAKSPMLAVRFHPKTLAEIKRRAEHRRLSAARIIRELVTAALAAEKAS